MSVYAEVSQAIQFYPNLAIEYHPEEFVADKVLAKIPVSIKAGTYTTFKSDTAFQIWDDTMSNEGRANEISWQTGQDSYTAKNYSNTDHVDYDAISNNPVQVSWPEKKVGVLARNLKLNKELRTIALAKTATTYKTATAPGFGGKAWSDPAATPIKDVQVLRTQMAMPPNTIVMDMSTFITLQNHPNVLGQRPVLRSGSINAAELADLFKVDNLIISELKYNTSGNRGRTQQLGYAWAGVFFMCYRAPDEEMTTDTITWGSQFLVTAPEVEGPKVSQLMASSEGWTIRAWEDPGRGPKGSLMINAVHCYDLHVQAADLGAVLDVVSTS